MDRIKSVPRYTFYILAPILLKIIVSALCSETIGIYLQLSEKITDIASLNRRFAESGLGVISIGFSCLLLCLVYVIWWKKGLHKIEQPSSIINYVNYIVAGILLSIVLNYMLTFAIEAVNYHGYDSTEKVFFTSTMAIRILCLGIISPFCEELLFRGLVFDRLKERFSVNNAVIGSALLFGIYHGNVVQFVYASIMGLIMGYIMAKKDDIYAPFAFHVAANIAVIVIESIAA